MSEEKRTKEELAGDRCPVCASLIRRKIWYHQQAHTFLCECGESYTLYLEDKKIIWYNPDESKTYNQCLECGKVYVAVEFRSERDLVFHHRCGMPERLRTTRIHVGKYILKEEHH